MPKLTREEACVLLGARQLLSRFGACLKAKPADLAPAGITHILKELRSMSDMFDTELTKLRGDVAAQSTVISSATEAFRGLAARLVAAEAAAKNAGATDAQIAGVSHLREQLEANTASLASAIPANTDSGTAAPVTTDSPPVVVAEAPPVTSSSPVMAPVAGTEPPVAVDPAVLAANQAR